MEELPYLHTSGQWSDPMGARRAPVIDFEILADSLWGAFSVETVMITQIP